MTIFEVLSAIANIATAIGVGVAARQLLATHHQAISSFEDSLTSQYRVLTEKLPLQALFGEPLSVGDLQSSLLHFYRYFDLCNEQAFLYKHRRISMATWENWEDGIRTNMERPAFQAAWSEVARRAPKDFDHLRELCPPGAPMANAHAT